MHPVCEFMTTHVLILFVLLSHKSLSNFTDIDAISSRENVISYVLFGVTACFFIQLSLNGHHSLLSLEIQEAGQVSKHCYGHILSHVNFPQESECPSSHAFIYSSNLQYESSLLTLEHMLQIYKGSVQHHFITSFIMIK